MDHTQNVNISPASLPPSRNFPVFCTLSPICPPFRPDRCGIVAPSFPKEVDNLQQSPFPWRELKYLWWFPVYLAAYIFCEQLVISDYWATQTAPDSLIPFCAWFVIPYCLWYPLLISAGVWLMIRDRRNFRRYMNHLAIVFLSSAIFWILVPNGQDLRPIYLPGDTPLIRMVNSLYTIDTNTNVFPSIHVGGALCVSVAVQRTPSLSGRRLTRFAVHVLVILICLSTLFIKQHALLDAVGGLALALFSAIPVYMRHAGRNSRPSP